MFSSCVRRIMRFPPPSSDVTNRYSISYLSINPSRSRKNSVGIANRLRVEQPGFDFWQRQEIFLFSMESRPALKPTQSPIQWVLWALSPEIKQQWRDIEHSTPSSAEVKKDGAITPLPHIPP
jgi:hypothetical protein